MEITIYTWAVLGLITLIGAIAQSAIGFGYSLLTVPFYLLLLDSTTAIQSGMLLTLVVTVYTLPKVWKDAPRDLVKDLVVSTVFGLPIGIVFFIYADSSLIKLAVAVTIFVALIAVLTGNRKSAALTDRRFHRYIAGASSGAMVTSLAMAGPALAIYLQAIRAEKRVSRSVIFLVFAFSYPAAVAMQILSVGIGLPVLELILWLLPVAVIGSVAGDRLSRHIPELAFRRIILSMLLLIGIYLLVVSVTQS
ncbi:MAG: sulfite exporter TauE/SafE family protein [Pseudomonadota bacterium]